MSMLLIDMSFHTLNVSQPLTLFCPPDTAFFSSKYPQPPLRLLQYHALPLKLEGHEDLSFIHHGSKIDTLLPGHPLVVTTLPTDQYKSLNKVRVTDWNLYNDGGLIVHGVDNFLDPAFQTLLYPGFDVKNDGILDKPVSLFSWVEELPNEWYLLLAFVVIGLGLLVFTFYRCYEYGHDDDYVPIQDEKVEDVDV